MTLSMTNYNFGDVVLTYFPFTDQVGRKKRPAVVLSSSRYIEIKSDVIVLAITSNPEPKLELGEFMLGDWQSAGLISPSAVKAHIATVLHSRIDKKIGVICNEDKYALRQMISSLLC